MRSKTRASLVGCAAATVVVSSDLVRIDNDKLAALVPDLKTTQPVSWDFYLPADIKKAYEASPKAAILNVAYALAVNSAVQFCFWTRNADASVAHWVYDANNPRTLGSGGMTQLLIDQYAQGKHPGFHLNAADTLAYYSKLFADIGMPLANERAQALAAIANRYAFDRIIKSAVGRDGTLNLTTAHAEKLARAYPAAFADPWLKKAQLALGSTATTLAAKGVATRMSVTGYADYRLPQVLRHLGVLVYSPALARKVDSRTLIAPGSHEERAIRAATISICATLAEKAGVDDPVVDAFLFLKSRAEDFRANAKPFHLTVTTAY